jgi:hypothetical protein
VPFHRLGDDQFFLHRKPVVQAIVEIRVARFRSMHRRAQNPAVFSDA